MTGTPRKAKKTAAGAEPKPKQVRVRLEVRHWGVPTEGTKRFSLARNLPNGKWDRLGLAGAEGVVVRNWPLEQLTIDWVQRHHGVGRYQATWLGVDAQGKLSALGKSRQVDIVQNHGAPAPARSVRTSTSVSYEQAPHGELAGGVPLERSLATLPPEVVDRRIAAEQEITRMRLTAQREIFDSQLAWERRQSEERMSRFEERFEERLDELRSGDDDEPRSEWAWLRDLVEPLLPMIKEAAPAILARLAQSGGTKT